MSASTILSRLSIPPGVGPNDAVTMDQLASAAAGAAVPASDLYRPLTAVWPAVDAVNGPLIADGGIVNAAPSLTGYGSLIRWDSGRFNTQSQNWLAVPSAVGPATNQCCQNVTTPRGNTLNGIAGLSFPCVTDFSFVADTAKVIVAYWQYKNNQQFVGVSTSHSEVDMFVEHDGRMKSIRDDPALWPGGSGGNQMMYREVKFSRALRREFRIMLSAGSYLAGIYVDIGADVQKAPNRPLLFGYFGDSWAEGAGNVFNSFGGNTSAAGVTWPTGCSLLRSNTAVQHMIATGAAGILGNQGGTGYFASNGKGTNEDSTTQDFTPFVSTGQVEFFGDTFGSRYPIPCVCGGWNDGTGAATPYLASYKAMALKGYRKLYVKLATQATAGMPLLVEGIQVKSITVGDARDLSNQGLAAAVADMRSVDGRNAFFIDNITDRNYVSIASTDFGPDGIHLNLKGGNNVGINRRAKAASWQVSRQYVAATLAA